MHDPLVHTKRTCKTATVNVSEAEIIAALIYDKYWGFKWLLRRAVRNNNTELLKFLYDYAENCSEKHASEHGIMKWPWHGIMKWPRHIAHKQRGAGFIAPPTLFVEAE